MKNIVLSAVLFAASCSAGFGQSISGGDGCQAPCYTPSNCATATPRSLETPRGAYVRSPETGEQAGESSGYGLRGFGVRLPAISLDLPEIRFPSLVKYRRNPEMHVEGSRAPWVEGRALEFNQVPRNLEEQTPRSIEQPREMCIPPAPCTSETEKRLREELARKENELQQIQSRFDRLEGIVERLAEAQVPSGEVPTRSQQITRPARVIEANYTDDSDSPDGQRSRSRSQPISIRSSRQSKTRSAVAAGARTDNRTEMTTEPDSDELGVWRQQRQRLSQFAIGGVAK